MPKSLKVMRDEVEAFIGEMPAGWAVTVDPTTDNVLVANDKIGFCITRKALDDSVWQHQIRPTLDAALALSDEEVQKITSNGGLRLPGATIQSAERMTGDSRRSGTFFDV
jgi:hypothetical protein